MPRRLREDALAIWQAALDAARPEEVVVRALTDPSLPLSAALTRCRRILVVGAGKAGVAMAQALESALIEHRDRITGWINVPAPMPGSALPTLRTGVVLHPARPAGSNHPTAEGVVGAERMLELLASAGPDDVALCLISGGGSALLPAPVAGVPLEDKQAITRLLHGCGATINEMNTVRKHLSRIKGGQLAQAFRGRALFSLIISDVIGDPLDVIASGPTAPDPTTFADALAVLDRYSLRSHTPARVLRYLEEGARGEHPETLKQLPAHVHNVLLGNNERSLRAAQSRGEERGYRVLNLGSYLEGETRPVAIALAGIVRSIKAQGIPLSPPVCVLSGGETTVTLGAEHGKGGRNQEFVLAAAVYLGADGLRNVVVLSGGTDGEDGPTDAAGALAEEDTLARAAALGLRPADFLAHHNAYPFFAATGDLLCTGLTHTNVMDVRLFLVGGAG